MADYERRTGGGRGHGYNNRKRRYRDDDDYDRRPQRRKVEEPTHVKVRRLLLNIAESPVKKTEDEISVIAKTVADDYGDEQLRTTFVEMAVQLVIEQPLKVPFVAAIVLGINPQRPELAEEILARAGRAIQEHVEAGAWREVKLVLRFLACMQGLLEGDGVFTILEELFSRAADLQTASSEDSLGLELVKIILLTIPYVLSSSATGFEDQASALLEKTDIIASAPHPLVALVDPYPGFGEEEAKEPQSVISILQKQLQNEAISGWPLACLPRVWKVDAGAGDTDQSTSTTKHALPSIIVPSPVSPGPRPRLPEIYFSVYADQDIETVPSLDDIASSILRDSLIDTINVLDFNRNATAKFLIELDCYFAPDTFVKRATPFDRLKDVEGNGPTWKPEDVAVDAVFSQLFQLPAPEHKLVYYHSVLTESCKIAPAAIAPSLGRAIRYLYRNIDSMDLELEYRFMDWFSHHLSNFGFTWKWTEWVDDVGLNFVFPKKAFMMGALEKEIRLSFAQRIRGTLPEPYQPLITEAKEKDTPDFKYNSDQTPYAPQAREILRLVRAKAPDNEIQEYMTAIEAEAASLGVEHPLVPSTDALVTSILFIGSKSLSHVLSCIERTKALLLAIGPKSEAARRQIITSVMDYWTEKPGTGVNIVDKLLNYTILTPRSVIVWALSDKLHKGEGLCQAHTYEMVSVTLFKVTNRVRQVVIARNASDLPPDQRGLLDETLQREQGEMRTLFGVVEDALAGVAEGAVDAMAESRDQDEKAETMLRAWGGRWLKVFRRKMAVEEAWVGEMLEAGPKGEEMDDVKVEDPVVNGNQNGSGMANGLQNGAADIEEFDDISTEEADKKGQNIAESAKHNSRLNCSVYEDPKPFSLIIIVLQQLKHPSAADWDEPSGLLAYGAERNIAIWEPLDKDSHGVRALLRGHTDTVNAVIFCRIQTGQPSVIVSGSSDKTIQLWQSQGITSYGFMAAAILEGHTSSINCLAFSPKRSLIVSGSADGTLKTWLLALTENRLQASLVQTIQTSPQLYPLTLALGNLGVAGNLVLAVAGTKGIVRVYVTDTEHPHFCLQATLVGHESWVRSLAITCQNDKGDEDLLLASASQDKYIRLWRIRLDNSVSTDAPATRRNFMSSLSNKAHRLTTSKASYLLTFEALLLGHEDWIYTVQWRTKGAQLQLLSASADNSLAIWEAEASSGIWLCNTRLGEISSQKGSTTATGSTGGFWIGLWSPNGQSAVSLGRTGSWRLWNHDEDSDRWTQGLGVSGHVGSITGVAWAKDGSFLLSTGSDQTTRLHAAWRHGDACTWHEFARPQIHGYDLNCIDSIGTTQFISGADEKSLRVFDEPRATAELLQRLCGISLPRDRAMPDAANIPMLGLSNKVVDGPEDEAPSTGADIIEKENPDRSSTMYLKTLDLDHPPLEDNLARHTLWPEREKLYGHGYEISTVATSHDGKLIATACRASSVDHAVIRLYETNEWREMRPALTSHSLTVTCLRFSEDDKYLLSVGRDRQWTVFERDATNPEKYILATSNPKGHTRMILNACWAPIDAGRIFATASRDKSVKVWKLLDKEGLPEAKCLTTLIFTSAVTAVDILPLVFHNEIITATGTEDGEVSVSRLALPLLETKSTDKLEDALRPTRTITQLAWRPQHGRLEADGIDGVKPEVTTVELVVASEDNSLRLFNVSRSLPEPAG